MAQSDDQGPEWFFRWVGYHDANRGMARFLGAVVAFIIVFGTLMWSTWPI
jgi:hypothetical protein